MRSADEGLPESTQSKIVPETPLDGPYTPLTRSGYYWASFARFTKAFAVPALTGAIS